MKAYLVTRPFGDGGMCDWCPDPVYVFKTHEMADEYIRERRYPAIYYIQEIDAAGF